MTITIDFVARDVPCQRCGWLDGSGGVELTDDQRVKKALCHQCVVDLVRACLPNGRFGSYETTPVPELVTMAS
jgi:hypothetical protein